MVSAVTSDAGETVKDGKDSRTGIPIVSLYGDNKKPSATQLKDVDVILFDIQDVGARFLYLYKHDVLCDGCLCREQERNDCTGSPQSVRLCGWSDTQTCLPVALSACLPIPVLHGCTIGELAQMINGEGWIANKKILVH